jgi:Ca-activated chloride channel homolog
MRRITPFLAAALAAFVLSLAPATVGAQDRSAPSRVIDPVPPTRCLPDCWWPVGVVAQLDAIDVHVEVAAGHSVARYRSHLSNPADPLHDVRPAFAEGRIVFPVPPGSSVTDLSLSGGPETLEGRLLDADEATRIYEEIVRRMIDPALLRSMGDDLYEVRAFPVPIGEQRQVSFTVTTPLLAEGAQALVEVPWSRMSPRPAGAVVAVDVDVPWAVRSAIAPGFELATERLGPGQLRMSWESAAGWTPDANLRLYLGGGEGLVDTRLLAYREAADDGFFALLLAPALDLDTRVARDLVLVLDTSGSMEGEKFRQAIDAATFVLERLGPDDRFAIVRFSRDVHVFGEGLHPASDAADGIAYLRSLVAGGNTNISGALERGLGLLGGDRPGTVIFLTDGLPTAGIVETEGILRLAGQVAPERTQLFAFGVGWDVDTILLDALSTRFVGSSHYVAPEERIDTEVARLFERVATPVLTDVRIEIEGVAVRDVAPVEVPGLFAGHQALLTGRYEGAGTARVTVTGDSAQGRERFTYEVVFPDRDTTDPTVAQLWAQRRVADLLTELRLEGRRDALIEEIVAIATRFGIVTPFTAYLAEERDLAFSPEAALQAVDDAVAGAPSSGERAVRGAADLEELREGRLGLGTDGVRVVGAHSFYLLDGTWVRHGFEPGTDAPEVLVGSEAFMALVVLDPAIVDAAALGARVVTEGPDGWVTLVWPAPVEGDAG